MLGEGHRRDPGGGSWEGGNSWEEPQPCRDQPLWAERARTPLRCRVSPWDAELPLAVPGSPGSASSSQGSQSPRGWQMGQDSRRQLHLSSPIPPGTHGGGTARHHDNCQRSQEASSASFISDIINHVLPGKLPGCDTIPGGPHPPRALLGATGMVHHTQSPLTRTPGRVLPSHPCSSSPSPSPSPLTLLGHSNFEALLEPAVLAPVACHLVDDAVLVPVARVHHVLLDAAAEEALGTRHAPVSARHGDPEHPGEPGEPWRQSGPVAALTLQPSQALTP